MKRFAILGLGHFGFHVAKTLYQEGHDVLGIDNDKDKVQRASEFSSQALLMDATNKENLKPLGLDKMDAVVVSTGKLISQSILITLYLKELEVKNIVVKALNEDHGDVLEKVGASEVIYPERDTAMKLAKNLSTPNILDFLPFSEEYAIVEWAPTREIVGSSLKEAKLRNRYDVYVIAVKEIVPDRMVLIPSPDFVIKDSDILVIIGKQKDLQKLRGAK
ncbi:MAG: potassium transporter TrkA [candidate division Zixibacteria bacterium SM23_73_2]|nr:MAG: potassium transporter TrkA [candidate division Zixibacteria bacterium SM23_73_2]